MADEQTPAKRPRHAGPDEIKEVELPDHSDVIFVDAKGAEVGRGSRHRLSVDSPFMRGMLAELPRDEHTPLPRGSAETAVAYVNAVGAGTQFPIPEMCSFTVVLDILELNEWLGGSVALGAAATRAIAQWKRRAPATTIAELRRACAGSAAAALTAVATGYMAAPYPTLNHVSPEVMATGANAENAQTIIRFVNECVKHLKFDIWATPPPGPRSQSFAKYMCALSRYMTSLAPYDRDPDHGERRREEAVAQAAALISVVDPEPREVNRGGGVIAMSARLMYQALRASAPPGMTARVRDTWNANLNA